jgi:WD40 repeat protein
MANGYLVSGNYNQIRITDTILGDLIHFYRIEGRSIYSVKILKNGDIAHSFINYTYGDNAIQIRDPASFEVKFNCIGHSDEVRDLVELPNGDLASASQDKTIKIWDTTTGEVKETLYLHTSKVGALALLKNGLLASGSNGTIVISKI